MWIITFLESNNFGFKWIKLTCNPYFFSSLVSILIANPLGVDTHHHRRYHRFRLITRGLSPKQCLSSDIGQQSIKYLTLCKGKDKHACLSTYIDKHIDTYNHTHAAKTITLILLSSLIKIVSMPNNCGSGLSFIKTSVSLQQADFNNLDFGCPI